MTAADWARRDAAVVWHGFTQMAIYEDSTPVIVERGEGNYLYDTDGRRYLDAISSLWVITLGHADPDLNRAAHSSSNASATQLCGIRPDLMCLGKGITGGYLPLSATVAASHVYEAFLGEDLGPRTFYHGHSYSGNALACAVAARHLELISERSLIDRAASAAERLGDALAPERAVVARCGLGCSDQSVRNGGHRLHDPPRTAPRRRLIYSAV